MHGKNLILVVVACMSMVAFVCPVHGLPPEPPRGTGFVMGFDTSVAGDMQLFSLVGTQFSGVSTDGNLTVHSGLYGTELFYRSITNEPPEITSPDTVYAEEDSLFTYTARATDPDDSVVTISFENCAEGMVVDGAVMTWTPGIAEPEARFLVVASDGSLRDTLAVTIITLVTNEPPEITSAVFDTTSEGELYTYTATAVDPEGVPVHFTFEEYPSWMGDGSVKEDSTISGIAPEGAKSASFTITAHDGRHTVSRTVLVTIVSVNNPPVIQSDNSAAATEDAPFTYVAVASDPDDSLDIWFGKLPPNWDWDNVVSDQVTGDVLKGTPLDGAARTFWIYASDGHNTDSLEVFVDIQFIEEPPVITSPSYVKVLIGQTTTYQATARDPEQEEVQFLYKNIPPWCTVGGDSLIVSGAGFFTDVVDSFVLVAVDPAGLSDTASVLVEAKAHNAAPEITSPQRVSGAEDSLFVYTVTVHDSDDASWIFSYENLPPWLSRTTTDGIRAKHDSLSGIPPGTHDIVKFTVMVSDGGENNDTLEVFIDIEQTNDAPEILSQPKTVVTLGEEYVYRVRAVDPEEQSITFTLEESPDAMTIHPSTGLITWVPTAQDGDSVQVQVAVEDDDGAVTIQTFSISILSDNRPRCTLGTITNSRFDVVIPFTLNDANKDSLSLAVYFQQKGEWIVADTVGGVMSGIGPSGYEDTLVWHSAHDMPGIKTIMKIRVVPSDTVTGFAAESNEFMLDNSPAMHLTPLYPAPDSLVSVSQATTLRLALDGPGPTMALLDTTSVMVAGVHSGTLAIDSLYCTDSTLTVLLGQLPAGGDTLSVTFHADKIRDTTGKYMTKDVSWSFRSAWLGDFNLDDSVNFHDLSYVSKYWYAHAVDTLTPDEFTDIGPAAGEVPYLIPATLDTAFDFEDVCVFLSMWRWFYGSATSAKVRGQTIARLPEDRLNRVLSNGPVRSLAKRSSRDVRFEPAPQSTELIQPVWSIEKGEAHYRCCIDLDIDNIKDLAACRFTVNRDQRQYGRIIVAHTPLFEQEAGNAVVLTGNTAYDGGDIQIVRLSGTTPGISGSGCAARLVVPIRDECNPLTPLRIDYELVNTSHHTMEKGSLAVRPEQPAYPTSLGIGNLRAGPNPARVSGMRVPFAVSNRESTGPDMQKQSGVALWYTVSVPKDVPHSHEQLMVSISIYDNMGNPVVFSGEQDLLRCAPDKFQHPGTFEYATFWDCRGESGKAVSPGIYRAILRWRSDKRSDVMSALIGIR